MINIYRTFAPGIYRKIIWIVYPIMAVICCFLVQINYLELFNLKHISYMLVATILNSVFVYFEGMSDFFIFGGITSKNAPHVVFLKLSKKGKMFFKKALIVDKIRRISVILIVNVINVIIGRYVFDKQVNSFDMLIILNMCVIAVLLSEIIVTLCRFFENVWMNFLITYCIGSLFVFLRMIGGNSVLFRGIIVIIGVVITGIVSIYGIYAAIKKLEG